MRSHSPNLARLYMHGINFLAYWFVIEIAGEGAESTSLLCFFCSFSGMVVRKIFECFVIVFADLSRLRLIFCDKLTS